MQRLDFNTGWHFSCPDGRDFDVTLPHDAMLNTTRNTEPGFTWFLLAGWRGNDYTYTKNLHITSIVKFNPWNFTTTGQLIDQFFATMSNKLKLSKSDKRLQTVGGLIEKYSSVLEYTQYIPVVGPYLDVVKSLAKAAGKEMKETADKKLHDATIQKAKIEATARTTSCAALRK